jgi:ATP-dependent Lon protease
MKSPTKPKLLSKRSFARKLDQLKQEHSWIIKGKEVEIKPGWIELLNQTFHKMRQVLDERSTEESSIEFIYCANHYRLNLFLDASKLAEPKFKVIEHLIERLRHDSEMLCPKCGRTYEHGKLSRSERECEGHENFDGQFLEEYRRSLSIKTLVSEKTDEDSEAEEDAVDSETAENLMPPPVLDQTQLRVYDLEKVKGILASLKNRSADSDQRNRIKTICEELIKRGEYRPYCELPEPSAFDDLAANYPNFQESIDLFKNAIALAKIGDGRLDIPPLLLVGPPGIGKTQVANEIARVLATDFVEIRMETEQSGASLTGSSEFWSNTQVGLVFKALTSGKTANPVIMLDELDKVSGDPRYDPYAGLYSLLERETAKRFEDQSLRGVTVDASGIIWIITANNMAMIPEPILSRVMVHQIRPPTPDESLGIAHRLYTSIRNVKAWGAHFEPQLRDEVAERLAEMEPRRMKVSLLTAFGRAAIASRGEIRPDDLPRKVQSVSIGFTASAE